MINSFTVLSHHQAYRSVLGGSLKINVFSIRFGEALVSKDFEISIRKCYGEYRTIGGSPIALSCVRPLPSLLVFNTASNEIVMFGLGFLPLFPVAHA